MADNPYRNLPPHFVAKPGLHGWMNAADVWDEGYAAGVERGQLAETRMGLLLADADADAARLAKALSKSRGKASYLNLPDLRDECDGALWAHRERTGE